MRWALIEAIQRIPRDSVIGSVKDAIIARRGKEARSIAKVARTIAALLALRDQVIAPILAGVRSPRMGRKPATWTPVDRDYETLRIAMQALFRHLGITAAAQAA
jgi:hypothetical protein